MTDAERSRLFESIVLPHLDDAYSLARWLVGDQDDAEDVVQDACVRALDALAATQVARPRAWLLAIVRNTAMSWIAKNRPRHLVAVEEVASDADTPEALQENRDPEAILIEEGDAEALTQAIAALPPLFREALVMRDVNGLSYREISEASGAPIGTVMSRIARARDQISLRLTGAARPKGAA